MILSPKYLIYFIVFLSFSVQADCPRKNDVLGLLEIHQTYENGHCLILISQIDPNMPTKANMITKPRDHSKRRYTFRSDGYVELYEPEKVQEIQFLDQKTDLSYHIQNDSVVVQLPSGQRLSLGTNQTGNPGLVQTFTGFSSAKETTAGMELVPSGTDSLLISPSSIKGYPHQKKGVHFDYLTSEGKKLSAPGTLIFNAGGELPTLKKDVLTTLLQRRKSLPLASNERLQIKKESGNNPPAINQTQTPRGPSQNGIHENSNKANKASPAAVTIPPNVIPPACSIDQLQVSELNADYLKIQGELSLSKLAYFYLKDSDGSTDKLEEKIRALLKYKDLEKMQSLLSKKVSLNASLGLLKNELLESQKKWTAADNTHFLLSDIDFKFFSLVSLMEKLKPNKKTEIINYIRMIDSSYKNSSNTKEEKFRKLESRFKFLTQRRDEIVQQLKSKQDQCHAEARPNCIDCLLKEKDDNLADLKNIMIKEDHIKSIAWGSFWLHTGRRGK